MSKSDLGGYTYGQNAGPHAVTSVNTTSTGGCTLSSTCMLDGVQNPNIFYDADGNMTCITTKPDCSNPALAARNYAYTTFDMAETLQNGANTATISYSPEHQRGSLTTGGSTLYYFSNPAAGVNEELMSGANPNWRSYLAPYGHIAAEMFISNGITTPYYFVGDHLFSTAALTTSAGASEEHDSYDAWGRRRYPWGADETESGCGAYGKPPSATLRGYTGQEEMDSFCLVNLNARIYDPSLGRMLSADPVIGQAFDGQVLNRYSYVVNNPLTYSDPSGHCMCFVDVTMGLIISVNGQGAPMSNAGSEEAAQQEGAGGGVGTGPIADSDTSASGTNNSGTDNSGTGGFYNGGFGAPSDQPLPVNTDVETVVVTGTRPANGGGMGPSYLDGPEGLNPANVLDGLMEGQSLSVAGIILRSKNIALALKIFKFLEKANYVMIPIDQYYDGGDAIMNGAPAGTTILGATANSAIIAGAAFTGTELGAAFFGGEAIEPFGGGVLAVGGVFFAGSLLPSPPAMGQNILNGLGNAVAQPIWPPPF